MDDNCLLFNDDNKIKEFANQIAESIKDNEGNELNIIHQLLKDKLQSIKMHIDILKSQLDEEKRKLLK
jgi:signal transduction histidine kinase